MYQGRAFKGTCLVIVFVPEKPAHSRKRPAPTLHRTTIHKVSETTAKTDVVLGIDAGGTWMRLVTASMDGVIKERVVARCGRAELGAPVAETLSGLAKRLSPESRIVAAAGTNARGLASGWREAGIWAPYTMLSEAMMPLDPAGKSGVVLIAGTGSAAATVVRGAVTLVTGARGLDHDTGCAHSLAAASRDAVYAARSKKGPATELADMWPDNDALSMLHGTDLAALALDVDTAAKAGDGVANELCQATAVELVELILPHAAPEMDPVILVGSVASPTASVGAILENKMREHDIPIGHHLPDLTGQAIKWALFLAGRF